MSNSYVTILDKLSKAVETNAKYKVEDALNKNLLAEDARKYDGELLNLLQKDASLKSHFFTETDGGLVFKKDVFLQFISNKEFLPDSYTRYANKIGLGSDDGSLLSGSKDVVLNWPYKDAVLEGGQDKEDQKRSEVFFNEVLAPDQITRLLDDKVFTNWKRYGKDGEHDLDELKDNDNLIIKGNNLVVLHSLKKRYAGKVKLIYIDPPYNTGGDSFGYNDRFNHSTWLSFMKNRLSAARELLANNGVIVVQVDYREDAYLKVLMDEVFGRDKHAQTVIVKMTTASGPKMAHSRTTIPKLTESLLVYSMGPLNILEPPRAPKDKWDPRYDTVLDGLSRDEGAYLYDLMLKEKVTDEECSRMNTVLKDVVLTSARRVAEREGSKIDDEWRYANAWRTIVRSDNASLAKRLSTLKGYGSQKVGCLLNTRGKLVIYKGDADVPRSTLVDLSLAALNLETNLGNLWTDFNVGRSLAAEGGVQLSGGKKPERLLARLISMFTEEKDLILDYHLGSGTTAAVAHKMGRQYIGVEQMYYGDNDPTVRLQNVIKGDQTGISKSVDWQGGGSFVYANIMNNANTFRERVEKAKDDKEYFTLLEEATSSSFLSYRVDPTKLNETEFRKLSSADKRRLLLELIDNNTLYVNYEDINDPSFKVSDSDKKFNEELYK